MTKSGIVNISLVPLRAEPSSKSELVSELLFGETYTVLEETEDWYKVENHSDGYTGWINNTQFTLLENSEIPNTIFCKFPFSIVKSEGSESPFYVLPGSRIFKNNSGDFFLNGKKYLVEIDSFSRNISIAEISKLFLNSPYLWGGKSLFGIDCSGFTQIVFSIFGLNIPRDAYLQAELGNQVDFISETKPGDLAFFENKDGKITHVGIIIENQKIIHASGKVRIDEIDSFGIFNKDSGKHSHQLRWIKRLEF
ncbi:MAG: NlpC/P60 family protein [Bacteroidia bacterium]